ncbi:MAG: divalent metal cation transporter [Verrucomicrobia bacterium]|nr:divalent metal cation transporter [Verrucomicrobiota bacterium]
MGVPPNIEQTGDPKEGLSSRSQPVRRGAFRTLGLGLITGAADADPSAIGTYAAAGAQLGPSFLWTAPVLFPMMFAVVYLSAKLGQVSGEGLFAVIRKNYSRWILFPALVAVLIGNVFEAGADIGGMAAALNILVPFPVQWLALGMALIILSFQIWGSYTLLRNIFRWLALSLLAYVAAAFLAKPELLPVLKGTLLPTIQFNKEFLSLLVAVIGTALSAYLYTWQSNEEVEEQIARGRTQLWQRKGATAKELRRSRTDVLIGMLFSSAIIYFTILSTASTLHKTGKTDVVTAADAAAALRPLAGDIAGLLFALGVVSVGFLAVPVMTTGAAYDLAQAMGWKYGLSAKPKEAKSFYVAIVVFSLIAVCINFIGLNLMKVLVWAGIVQGFSTPPLMLLMMFITNNRAIMGNRTNSRAINVLGVITTIAIFAATLGLVVTWF